MTVCGNSDPGTSGLVSPYSKIKGLNFDDSMEPDTFRFNYINAVKEVLNEEDVDYVDMEFQNVDEYYNILNSINDFNNENIKVSFVKRKKDFDTIEELEEEDLEETLSFSAVKREEDKKKTEKKASKKQK